MPVFQQFPPAVLSEKGHSGQQWSLWAARHCTGSCRLSSLPPISRPDGAQAGCDTPSTHYKIFPGSLGKGLHGCGSRRRANRDLWPDHMGQQALVSLLSANRAAHSSLRRRAVLNLRAAVETPVLAVHGWPQLIHSADPAVGSCKESCLVEAMLGCLWSWALAAAPAAFMWQDGSSRASSSDSCSLCFGDAGLLCLWACHLTVFNGLRPFP